MWRAARRITVAVKTARQKEVTMPPRLTATLLALAFGVGLAACGNDNSAAPTNAPEATATSWTDDSGSTTEDPTTEDSTTESPDAGQVANDICDQTLTEARGADDPAAATDSVANLLHATAASLSDADVIDLGNAVDAYATALDDLAVAYDQNLIEDVNSANEAVDSALADLRTEAESLGASSCAALSEL
jgi:hypothetical protein